MCNLYSVTTNQEAIRQLFGVTRDLIGNLPALPALFPDQLAPIVRIAGADRRLEMKRWGMPGLTLARGGLVTNIRNTKSPHWRRWLGPANRCLVPFNAFCEYEDTGVPKAKKIPTWLAADEGRSLLAFAGIWAVWHGTRGTLADPIQGEHKLFGLLTCEPNGIVGPIHPKAMPVILTTAEEGTSGCRRLGKRRVRCSARYPTQCSRSWRAARRLIRRKDRKNLCRRIKASFSATSGNWVDRSCRDAPRRATCQLPTPGLTSVLGNSPSLMFIARVPSY